MSYTRRSRLAVTGMDRAKWAERIRLKRYALARILIHTGLKVMPPGRGRSELTALLWTWNMKVSATVAAHRAARTGVDPDSV